MTDANRIIAGCFIGLVFLLFQVFQVRESQFLSEAKQNASGQFFIGKSLRGVCTSILPCRRRASMVRPFPLSLNAASEKGQAGNNFTSPDQSCSKSSLTAWTNNACATR